MNWTAIIITYAILVIISTYIFAKADTESNRDGMYVLLGFFFPLAWFGVLLFEIIIIAKKRRKSKDTVKEE